MQLSNHFIRHPLRLIILCAATATLLGGCASYGSFDENEPGIEESLIGDFAGVLGDPVPEEPIDYSARAPLVVPPDSSQLPAPQESSIAANDPNWPTDRDARAASVLESDEQVLVFGRDGRTVDIEATQRLASAGGAPERRPDRDRDDNSRLSVIEMQRETEIERSRLAGTAEINPETRLRERRYLTDPPESARQPSPDAEFAISESGEIVEDEKPWWQLW
ncbi:MAG: hypothetical protein AAF739_00970 [Pseudomonadota bacterium]